MAQRKRPAVDLTVDKSPAKKGGNAPTMQDYPSNMLNAWMLICKMRHSATAPERKTGKAILFCQYSAAHPVPGNIQEMMDAIVEACPFHVFVGLGTNPAKPEQFRCEVWRAEELVIAHDIMRQYNSKMPDISQKCKDRWDEYVATPNTITATIDEAAFSVRVTGHTMALKKYLETEAFGSPAKIAQTEPEWGYIIQNADMDMVNETMANLEEMCTNFNFTLTRQTLTPPLPAAAASSSNANWSAPPSNQTTPQTINRTTKKIKKINHNPISLIPNSLRQMYACSHYLQTTWNQGSPVQQKQKQTNRLLTDAKCWRLWCKESSWMMIEGEMSLVSGVWDDADDDLL
jgi:hypothetical protein